jgi:hypothetical protein
MSKWFGNFILSLLQQKMSMYTKWSHKKFSEFTGHNEQGPNGEIVNSLV